MNQEMHGTPPTVRPVLQSKHYGRRLLSLGFVASTAAALFVGGMGATASAAPDGTTVANVEVGTGITLTGLTTSFTLTGIPTDTADLDIPVTYNVVTNDDAGYTVTARASATTLSAALPNLETIPIAALTAKDGTETDFLPLTNAAVGTLVHSQDERSAADGDELSTDFRMLIPNVVEDTYSVTLTYLATVAG